MRNLTYFYSIDEILASSDESDDEEDRAKKWNDKGQSYIEEDPDNIIDFLTPTATGRITGKVLFFDFRIWFCSL